MSTDHKDNQLRTWGKYDPEDAQLFSLLGYWRTTLLLVAFGAIGFAIGWINLFAIGFFVLLGIIIPIRHEIKAVFDELFVKSDIPEHDYRLTMRASEDLDYGEGT
jgi:hypothetical protein